jgi:tRNA 2-thiouridine synthesizing protein A
VPGEVEIPSDAVVVDAREKACPMPLLELARALAGLAPGRSVLLLATDPATQADLRSFCSRTGHALVSVCWDGRILRGHVRKKEGTHPTAA